MLFSQAGLSGTEASFIASGVSGLVNFVCTILCQFFTDKCAFALACSVSSADDRARMAGGRRPSMIRGGAVISVTMLVIGALYASGESQGGAGRWVIIVFIYLYVVAFACTWAIIIRIIVTELQPTRTRAAVSSLGQCVNWVRTTLLDPSARRE